MEELEKFNPLAVSSKFAICGLPIRMDTYRYCTFGCKYCFSNNRKIMEFEKKICVGDAEWLEKKLCRVESNGADKTNFLDTLIEKGITFHCGGMADPFQPCEEKLKATEECVDICNKHGRSILFSTKTDTVYGVNVREDLHTFQLSITGAPKDVEPNVPNLEKRIEFFRQLKKDGFKVGIRLQPFIPNVTTLDIVKEFQGADNFTIEGIKIVPQNEEAKIYILKRFGFRFEDFKQMGLLNLLPEIRMHYYKPFIDYFEKYGIPYSIADNDMHHLGTNYCCCGDGLVKNTLLINNTTMCHLYGKNYAKEQLDKMIDREGVRDCKCSDLFTSNRTNGCESVQDFYNMRFYQESSPFSPLFLHTDDKETGQMSIFDFMEGGDSEEEGYGS